MNITTKKIRNALQRAHDAIERGWCKNQFAMDKHGIVCRVFSNRACKFCALGAVIFATHEGNLLRSVVSRKLQQSIPDRSKSIPIWNDEQRSKRPVLAAFKKAIALCK